MEYGHLRAPYEDLSLIFSTICIYLRGISRLLCLTQSNQEPAVQRCLTPRYHTPSIQRLLKLYKDLFCSFITCPPPTPVCHNTGLHSWELKSESFRNISVKFCLETTSLSSTPTTVKLGKRLSFSHLCPSSPVLQLLHQLPPFIFTSGNNFNITPLRFTGTRCK